ncbi:MAG: GHKL domain-containing protein [Bacteroidales bacterium]|nr:GHKL domain-containing protein [Bacteroidales bacterium]
MKKICIILIAIALIVVSIFIYHKKEKNENDEMELFAKIIADETDRDFEDATINIIDKIKNDELPSDDSLLSYFNEKYFNHIDLYKNYNRTLNVCDSTSVYVIYGYDTILDCFSFHDNYLNSKPINENLSYIDDGTPNIYYSAKINLNESKRIYIEFYKERIFNPNLKNYSFAIYNSNILNYKLGNYYYPNNLNNFISQENGFHKGKNFKHLIFNNLDNDKAVVVTIDSVSWMKSMGLFSLIFFALLLSYLIYYFVENGRSHFFKHSFQSKMQITILLTLAISFFVIGVTSFVFLRNNITKKTQINQYKQANIIRNNLETNILDNNIDYVSFILEMKESFFCDINIYDLYGNLTTSTIDGAIPYNDTINQEAFNSIINEEAGYFVQTEFYENERNTSYYLPILDKNDKLEAILDVIYFDSTAEYDDRISDFVLNYINIIIVLLIISSIIVLLITRKTLKPLKIIEEQMGKIDLEGKNEPINFRGRDEIGALVQQYNNMCRQLEIAANKLARNERENAWREMARQVAHEIKNPLTPMRLNIEYLQMLWDKNDPNFEKNFKETIDSLLEQIETLSKIATAFSDYAKLPENVSTTFDLTELLKSTIKLYDVEKNISITLVYNENDDWSLYADKNNIGRVIGNIIKNAIQAIGNETGFIKITLGKSDDRYKISIEDNGCGIKEEDKKKVFFPNFTTKSSGMGVGLSVSQDIMQAMGGNISFTSKVGIGTVFTIDVPILKEI